jgi:hypothetical protein
MGLADRDYMKGHKKPVSKPSPLARVRFALWLFGKWLKGLFRHGA